MMINDEMKCFHHPSTKIMICHGIGRTAPAGWISERQLNPLSLRRGCSSLPQHLILASRAHSNLLFQRAMAIGLRGLSSLIPAFSVGTWTIILSDLVWDTICPFKRDDMEVKRLDRLCHGFGEAYLTLIMINDLMNKSFLCCSQVEPILQHP